MIKRTICQYDIHHTGDEMDRAEILHALNTLAKLCDHSAEVTFESAKTDLITLTIETVEAP